MKIPVPKRIPIMTVTDEVFLPTRLVYEVYDVSRLRSWLVKTSCMAWDARLRRWTWNHCGAALKLKFPPSYDKVPEEHRPVVLASCYLVDEQTFHVYTRCGLRAAEFLSFFDRKVPRSTALGKFIDQYNLITDVAPGEPLPVPEDYFKDEAKIYFFDLAGLLDSPDSPAKKAALDAYDAARETRTWRPLERHRLDLFYEDGPEEMKQASVFRELMAGLQYRSVKPIRPVEEMNRLLAQQQVVIRAKP
jgi:hypothetical protein